MTASCLIRPTARTHELVRLAATIEGCSQGDVVDRAVAEYLRAHRPEVEQGFKRARALLGVDD